MEENSEQVTENSEAAEEASGPVAEFDRLSALQHQTGEDEKVAEDWLSSLNEEMKNNSDIRIFKDSNELAEKYLELKSSAEQDSGIPESAKDYEYETKEGVTVNKEMDTKFREFAIENKLNQTQFKKLNEFAFDTFEEIRGELSPENIAKEIEAEVSAAKEELSKEWGTSYDKKIDKVKYALSKELGENGIKMIEDAGLAANPSFLKMMSKFSDFITEDTHHYSGNTSNLSAIESKIDSIMGEKNGAYFDANHPGHASKVKEMEDLLNMKQKI